MNRYANGLTVVNITPRICRYPLLVLGCIGLSLGCSPEAVHPGLNTQSTFDSPSPTPDPINDSYWSSELKLDETWVTGDSTLHLWIIGVEGERFDAWLQHTGGSLEVGETSIPMDSWLKTEGYLLNERRQLWLEVTQNGHRLVYDADLFGYEQHLSGYFILDDTYEVFQTIERGPRFEI